MCGGQQPADDIAILVPPRVTRPLQMAEPMRHSAGFICFLTGGSSLGGALKPDGPLAVPRPSDTPLKSCWALDL